MAGASPRARGELDRAVPLGTSRNADPDVRSFSLGALTWTWDVSDVGEGEWSPDNRLVGVYGLSTTPLARRASTRMRGFPLTQGSTELLHRGHAAAHSVGGPDEGFNLLPQLASLNLGKEWRSLERIAAERPGTRLAVRAIYDDSTDRPALIEMALLTPDGVFRHQAFANREAT